MKTLEYWSALIWKAGWSLPSGGTRQGPWYHMVNRDNDHLSAIELWNSGYLDASVPRPVSPAQTNLWQESAPDADAAFYPLRTE